MRRAVVGAGLLSSDEGYIKPDATVPLPDLKGVSWKLAARTWQRCTGTCQKRCSCCWATRTYVVLAYNH